MLTLRQDGEGVSDFKRQASRALGLSDDLRFYNFYAIPLSELDFLALAAAERRLVQVH